MKNNKMLLVSLLTLTFGAVSQIKTAVNVKILNKTGNKSSVFLYSGTEAGGMAAPLYMEGKDPKESVSLNVAAHTPFQISGEVDNIKEGYYRFKSKGLANGKSLYLEIKKDKNGRAICVPVRAQ